MPRIPRFHPPEFVFRMAARMASARGGQKARAKALMAHVWAIGGLMMRTGHAGVMPLVDLLDHLTTASQSGLKQPYCGYRYAQRVLRQLDALGILTVRGLVTMVGWDEHNPDAATLEALFRSRRDHSNALRRPVDNVNTVSLAPRIALVKTATYGRRRSFLIRHSTQRSDRAMPPPAEVAPLSSPESASEQQHSAAPARLSPPPSSSPTTASAMAGVVATPPVAATPRSESVEAAPPARENAVASVDAKELGASFFSCPRLQALCLSEGPEVDKSTEADAPAPKQLVPLHPAMRATRAFSPAASLNPTVSRGTLRRMVPESWGVEEVLLAPYAVSEAVVAQAIETTRAALSKGRTRNAAGFLYGTLRNIALGIPKGQEKAWTRPPESAIPY